MDSNPSEYADNSDVQQNGEATVIRDLRREELGLVAGGIRSGGLVHVDK